jgi:hypothetical protein
MNPYILVVLMVYFMMILTGSIFVWAITGVILLGLLYVQKHQVIDAREIAERHHRQADYVAPKNGLRTWNSNRDGSVKVPDTGAEEHMSGIWI